MRVRVRRAACRGKRRRRERSDRPVPRVLRRGLAEGAVGQSRRRLLQPARGARAHGGHGGGSIINMASIYSVVGRASMPGYVAAKHGVLGLTRAAALDTATTGVRINCVGPSTIRMPLLVANQDEAGMAALAAGNPSERLGEPDEVASLVTWLASDESSSSTGAYNAVDGGFTDDKEEELSMRGVEMLGWRAARAQGRARARAGRQVLLRVTGAGRALRPAPACGWPAPSRIILPSRSATRSPGRWPRSPTASRTSRSASP